MIKIASLVISLLFSVLSQTNAQTTSAVSALVWSPSGEQLAILRGTDGPSCTPGNYAPHELDLMTISTNQVQTQPLSDNVCEVGDVAFSFDVAYLIARSSTGRIHILSAENLNILHIQETMIVGNGLKTSPVDFRYVMLRGGTSAGVFSFDVDNDDFNITLTGGVSAYAGAHSAPIRDADWDPTGNMIATVSDDATLAIWDLVQDVLISRINEPNGQAIQRVAWSQAGDLIAFSNQLGEISILDVTSQNIPFNFAAHNQTINRLDWSPDGTRLASASEDGTVKVWNAETGNLLETLTYSGPVYALDWSPDGEHIAFGGADISGNPPQIEIVAIPMLSLTVTPISTQP